MFVKKTTIEYLNMRSHHYQTHFPSNIIAHICIYRCVLLSSRLCTKEPPTPRPPFLLNTFSINLLFFSPHKSDLNHLIGVSIWVPNRPWGPPASRCNGWLCIGNTIQLHQQGCTNPPHIPSTLSCLPVSSFICGFPAFSCHSCYFLFMHVSLCLLPLLVPSATSIIVLQRHAQAGRGVQWRRAPGDPRSAFQFAGCQVKERQGFWESMHLRVQQWLVSLTIRCVSCILCIDAPMDVALFLLLLIIFSHFLKHSFFLFSLIHLFHVLP